MQNYNITVAADSLKFASYTFLFLMGWRAGSEGSKQRIPNGGEKEEEEEEEEEAISGLQRARKRSAGKKCWNNKNARGSQNGRRTRQQHPLDL
jgi:hypothetical protein